MFHTIQKTIPHGRDYPERCYRLALRTAVLRGKHYDNLRHAFHEEKTGANEYIPLRLRRPSVRYGLCRLVVDDAVALLFSEGHFPAADAGRDAAAINRALARIVKEARLNEVMVDAATKGSVGSVAVLFRVLGGRVFFSALDSAYLTPVWQADAPDTLQSVVERYKVKGKILQEMGYSADEVDEDYWFQREWNDRQEVTYLPLRVADARDGRAPEVDAARSVTHALGFVPVVWVKKPARRRRHRRRANLLG